jgi:hypothetical protein
MSAVITISEGYYTIETEGVTIKPEVDRRIEEAFKLAASIPAEDLNIRVFKGRRPEESVKAPDKKTSE